LTNGFLLINCEGKDGGVIVKVTGGAEPYEFDLQSDGITGGHIAPIKLNDSLYIFNGLTLSALHPVTGIPLSRLIEVEIADGNGCIADVQDYLYSSCTKVTCGEGLSTTTTSDEEIAYFCSSNDNSNMVLDTFSIGTIGNWSISDTAIVHIFEGQGKTGNLIASYSRANPPAPADFPLFTKATCLTVFIENDQIGTINNNYTIETSCAACDYAVEVIEQNADCANAEGKAFIKVVGSSDYTITLEGSFPLYQRKVQGGEVLEVANLLEGRYTFKIEENWFYCTQYITVDIGQNSGPEILNIAVQNETCDKQSTPNASAAITVTGGSGQYLYSISGDAFGSNFFTVPLDGSPGDLDARPDTVAFIINNLEGNGYLSSTNSYALVVKDAYLTTANCKDEAVLSVGDNCFNKKCEGTFFDHPQDTHVMPTDNPLSRSNYNDNVPFTAVVCPSELNKFVTVDFDTFYVAIGDTLRVFDSTGVASSDSLLIGAYTGFGLNGRSVTATNATGCLTFQFTPNNDGETRIGWFAQIECHQECDLNLEEAWVGKETCEYAKDGSIRLKASGGSGIYTYSLRPLGAALASATFQKNNIFENLIEGKYIYTIDDDKLPNCQLTDTLDLDRHPPITWTVKSPGLTCGATTSKVTIIPHGGSGQYKITPAGIEPHAAIINAGEEFTYELTGAGLFQFKINDAANKLQCYERFNVEVTDNCKFTCYSNEQFSSNSPFDGTGISHTGGLAGYRNYEHVEVTYCPHGDDTSVKAVFQYFETEEKLDVLSIYHGKGTAGELIGHFSGTSSPGTIISKAADGCLTFAFETNLVDNNFAGFLADLSCVSCKLSAKYQEVRGETFCWNATGDKNGSIKVAVENPDPNVVYEFQLQQSNGTSISTWKKDNNDDITFADEDDAADRTQAGILGVYQFGALENGIYQVAVRDSADHNCQIALLPVTIKEVEQLEVEVRVTNVNCQGEGGQICITPIRGSGQYSFSDDNFSMFMNTACFSGFNGTTLTINVIDDITHCEVTVSATIGSDCTKSCDIDFFDDTGWDGIAGSPDDGSALYGKEVDTTWIFCPTHDDKLIQIDFTDFLTSVEDTLTIIDGDGYGALVGHYSGANSPGLVRSSTGCLTVHFKSDENIEKKGWKAKVSCFYCPSDFKMTSNITGGCSGHTGALQLNASAAGYSQFVYSLDGIDWNNTSGYFPSIPTGTTKVYAKVKDIPNCVQSIDVYGQLNADIQATPSACGQNNGKITTTASGGSGSYNYIMNNATYTKAGLTALNLTPGTYYVTIQDGNNANCSVNKTIVITDDCVVVPPTPTTTCVKINAYVFLEGAHRSVGIMHTALNDKGYLPGQKPNAFFGTPTVAGQPYNISPWNYNGTEGAPYNYQTRGNNKAGYPADVVDWVLVSLRSGTAKSTTVCTQAALLHKDGSISFVAGQDCCQLDPSKGYYIVIEHRNHLMVMSHQKVAIVGGAMTYDFRNKDSYRALFGVGQKLLSSGVYAMYCGNGDQTSSGSADTNITGSDKTQWINRNGANSAYYYPDFDMNGDVNVTDKSVWLDNNGKACDVPNN